MQREKKEKRARVRETEEERFPLHTDGSIMLRVHSATFQSREEREEGPQTRPPNTHTYTLKHTELPPCHTHWIIETEIQVTFLTMTKALLTAPDLAIYSKPLRVSRAASGIPK